MRYESSVGKGVCVSGGELKELPPDPGLWGLAGTLEGYSGLSGMGPIIQDAPLFVWGFIVECMFCFVIYCTNCMYRSIAVIMSLSLQVAL